MADDKIGNVGTGPLQAPQPQKKTITKTTRTVSAEEAEKLIKQKAAEGKTIVEKDGKILIQSQAQHLAQRAQLQKPTQGAPPKAAGETAQAQTSETTARQTAELKGGSRVESKSELSQLKTTNAATGRLGDKPVLPQAQIAKPDAKVLESFMTKIGFHEQMGQMLQSSEALEEKFSQLFTQTFGSGGSGGIVFSGDDKKFMLLMLLLELGYQNRDINKKMTQTGQLLRGANTAAENTASEMEIIQRRTSGMVQYGMKKYQAELELQKNLKETAKTVSDGIFGEGGLRQIWAERGAAAAREEVHEAHEAADRAFGPQPPNEAAVSDARSRYEQAVASGDAAEIARTRQELAHAGGEAAVVDADSAIVRDGVDRGEGADPRHFTAGEAFQREAGTRAASFRRENTGLAARMQNAEAGLRSAEANLRSEATGAAGYTARQEHPDWPEGAVASRASLRGEAAVVRSRLGGSQAAGMREVERLEGEPNPTPEQRRRLNELRESLSQFATLTHLDQRIERIADDEARLNSSDDPRRSEHPTDWTALSGEVATYVAASEEAATAPTEEARTAAAARAEAAFEGPPAPPPSEGDSAAAAAPPPASEAPPQGIAARLDAAEARLDATRENMTPEERRLRTSERAAARERDVHLARAAHASVRIAAIDDRQRYIGARLGAPPPPSEDERRTLSEERAHLAMERTDLERGRQQELAAARDADARSGQIHDSLRALDPARRPTAAETAALESSSAEMTHLGSDLSSAETRASRARASEQDFAQIDRISRELYGAPSETPGLDSQVQAAEARLNGPPRLEGAARADAQRHLDNLTARRATLRAERHELLARHGLPDDASPEQIRAAHTAAETESRAANAHLGTARSAYAAGATRFDRAVSAPTRRPPYGELSGGGEVNPADYTRLPPGEHDPIGVPRPGAGATYPPASTRTASALDEHGHYRAGSGREWVADAEAARTTAFGDYWALQPGSASLPTATPPFQQPRYTADRYNSEFEPLRVADGPAAGPITAAEEANPFTAPDVPPGRRDAVLGVLQRRSLARADLVDQQASRVTGFAQMTNGQGWSASDASAYHDRLAAADAAEGELHRAFPNPLPDPAPEGMAARPEGFPETVPYPAPGATGAQADAARAYYRTRRDAELARLDAVSRSYSPPRDVSAARDRVFEIWGRDGESGGLMGARSRAPEGAARTRADAALTRANEALHREEPEPRSRRAEQRNDPQDVPTIGTAAALGRILSHPAVWQEVVWAVGPQLGKIVNATDYLVSQFTGIAREAVDKYGAVLADFREQLARANAMSSSEWARTLSAMEKTLKSTLK